MSTFATRALCATAITGVALLGATGIASAHVSVNAPTAAQGGYSVLEFRVPTESESASTTAVTVQLPGLASARTQPIAGWTSSVQKDAGELATSVTWTADPGVGVAPGQLQQFLLSAGPLPEQDSVEFPATQTYSDGSVVEWNQTTPADGTEPEYPAPTLTLAAGTGEGDDVTAAPTATTSGTETTVAAESSSTDNTARWLGGVGLVLGALGAALGIGAVVRGRRS